MTAPRPIPTHALTPAQRRLLDETYAAFRPAASWPPVIQLRVRLRHVLDVSAVCAELGHEIVACPRGHEAQGQVTLRLGALTLLPTADDDRTLVVRTIRYLARRVIDADGLLDEVAGEDAARDLACTHAEFRRAVAWLATDGDVLAGHGFDREGRVTLVRPSPAVIAHEDVATLDGYLAARDAERERQRRNTAAADRALARVLRPQVPPGGAATAGPAGVSAAGDGGHADDADAVRLPWAGLHPSVVARVARLFQGGHRNEAVRAAFALFERRVRERVAGRLPAHEQPRGGDLMGRAFALNDPLISLTPRVTESDRNEQRGYQLLAQGGMAWFRNVLSHDDPPELSEADALERLAVASLLLKRLDAAEAGPGPAPE